MLGVDVVFHRRTVALGGVPHETAEGFVEKGGIVVTDRCGNILHGHIRGTEQKARLFHAELQEIFPKGHAGLFPKERTDIRKAEIHAPADIGQAKRLHIMLGNVLLDPFHGCVGPLYGLGRFSANQLNDQRQEQVANDVHVTGFLFFIFRDDDTEEIFDSPRIVVENFLGGKLAEAIVSVTDEIMIDDLLEVCGILEGFVYEPWQEEEVDDRKILFTVELSVFMRAAEIDQKIIALGNDDALVFKNMLRASR